MNQANFSKFVLALLGNYPEVIGDGKGFVYKFPVEDVNVSENVKNMR